MSVLKEDVCKKCTTVIKKSKECPLLFAREGGIRAFEILVCDGTDTQRMCCTLHNALCAVLTIA